MPKKPELKTCSARHAVAILAVDNIQVSEFGLDVLKRNEEGLISYDEAKEEILLRARLRAAADLKVK